jgi:hypothetical protein
MIYGAICSPLNIDVQEGKVAVSFNLHRELDIPIDTIRMVKEAFQLLRSLGADDQGVIHILEAADMLMGCLVKSHLLKLLDVELGNCHENLKHYIVILHGEAIQCSICRSMNCASRRSSFCTLSPSS